MGLQVERAPGSRLASLACNSMWRVQVQAGGRGKKVESKWVDVEKGEWGGGLVGGVGGEVEVRVQGFDDEVLRYGITRQRPARCHRGGQGS